MKPFNGQKTMNQFTGRSGSALLIVLAFIVIIAVLLAVFLSNSQRALQQSESSASIQKTRLLGEVATAAIIEDLGDEMRAGADDSPAVGEIMKVTQAQAMMPGRVLKTSSMLSDSKFTNLVKQSVNGAAFFPGNNTATFSGTGRLRASPVSTETASKNQRVISAARWDKPLLLGDGSGLGNFTSAQVPDWILIDRDGAIADASTVSALAVLADSGSTNAKYVLGRFAYNIYRVDGLLDINVAGFDPAYSAEAVDKGSLAWADLRAIPGLSSGTSSSALIAWRNKESLADYSSMTEMIAGLPPGANASATPGPWGEPGGFFEPYSDGVGTDNRFFSRQDLLAYIEYKFGAAAGEKAALPFLTTFSADLNQPSFRPDPDRPAVQRSAATGGNDAFGDESLAVEAQINPPILDVSDTEGDPVVQRRFPLERLKYVIPNPPVANQGLIQSYFGLRWNSAANAWDYDADGDGNPESSILRLSEVAALAGAAKREPNMIELLKAAIATGSLGGQFDGGEALGSPRATGSRDASINYQIMRIAAAIIDQYDDDSFPTRISFGTYMAFGTENLPYLYGFRAGAYRQTLLVQYNKPPSPAPPFYSPDPATVASGPFPDAADVDGSLYRSVIMIQPIVWNPHAPAVPAGAAPTEFRITASSGLDVQPTARLGWWSASTSAYQDSWPSITGDPRDANPKIAFNPAQDYIEFSVAAEDAGNLSNPPMAAFREPYALKAPDYPPGSGAQSYVGGVAFSESTLSAAIQNDPAPLVPGTESHDETIGFRAGWSWSGPWQNGDGAKNLQEGRVNSNGIDFTLEYKNPSGIWIAYDAFEKFTNNEPYRLDRLSSGNPETPHMRYYLRADPRVDRYGARAGLQKLDSSGLQQGKSLRDAADSGLPLTAGWPDAATGLSSFGFTFAGQHWGLMSENTSGGDVRYNDPDGIRRLAMGGHASGASGLPMAYHNFTSRPVILNRPFRSVTELGHVLRDQPWKHLDFFSPESGDAALLDIFCLYEPEDASETPVVRGRVNLNTPHSEVIEALLRGVELDDGSALSDARAENVADALVAWSTDSSISKGPLRNRSELVGKYVSGTNYSGFSTELGTALSGTDFPFPRRRQNVLRALADAGTTRSWTFLIDLIVQSGRYTSASEELDDFVVQGEKRFWVHVGMDRFTGEVILKQVEEVHD